MKKTDTEVIARVLRLAAYLKQRRGRRVTLASICANVPGYDAHFDADGALIEDKAWEAVRKKLRRDLKLLESAFGIECDFDTSTNSYALRSPFFAPDERDVLVAAAALVRVEGIDDAQLAALGAAVDEHGQRIVLRVHRHVMALRDAIAARRPVTFRYRGKERVFDPWAVGLWHDRWYTVGHAHDTAERRVFRLDRIEEREDGSAIDTVGSPTSFAPPHDFDADHALLLDPNMWGKDPPVVAKVRVDPDWLHAFAAEFRGDIEPDGVVRVTVRHYESFRDRLLAFGPHAVLLEPASLVDAMVTWLEGVAR